MILISAAVVSIPEFLELGGDLKVQAVNEVPSFSFPYCLIINMDFIPSQSICMFAN